MTESKYSYKSGDPREWISISDLEEKQWYRGKCRNAQYAIWWQGKFHYLRHKFGTSFWEDINAPENDDGFDVFFAFKKAEWEDVKDLDAKFIQYLWSTLKPALGSNKNE